MTAFISDRVIAIIAEQAVLDISDVHVSSTLESLGIDSLGLVEAMIGPRSAAVAAPHRMGKRAAALPGSGWEVSLIWPLRFGAFIAITS